MKQKSIESLRFDNLNLNFDNNVSVFKDVTCPLPTNSVVWIRGESGSGKSVFAKLLCGLIQPTHGHYYLNGKSVSQMSFEEFLPYRCNMGYGFDFGGLINNRDILGNLLLPMEYHNFEFGPRDELINRAHTYLDLFGLRKVAHLRPSAIVGRLRKAACVARAFINNPQMLVLDDPTTGLNLDVRETLTKLLNDKFKNKQVSHVFIVTEDEEFMNHFNYQSLYIQNGSIEMQPKEVAA